MDEKAIAYVKNQIQQNSDRLLPYTRPTPNFSYPKRYAFFRIEKLIKGFLSGGRDQRWVVMPGLRGVGKTTILAQIYYKFREQLIANHIIYISIDDVMSTIGISLREVLEAYEKILGSPLEQVKHPVCLLIDEIQLDVNWALYLKALHDRARNIFIVCTGSSAVLLQTNPDIARRAVIEKLYPLSFGEFKMIESNVFPTPQLKQEIKNALYSKKTAKDVFEELKKIEPKINEYWKKIDSNDVDKFLTVGTLPFAIKTMTQPQAYEAISQLLDRMITKDLTGLGKFDIKTLSSIKRLLFVMADADSLSINKVSSILGFTNVTLVNVLEALEKAELIIRVPAHGSGAATARKPAKYLFMSPAIRMALVSVAGIKGAFSAKRGILLEDVVGLHFYREFLTTGVGILTHHSAAETADFIFQIPDKLRIAVEIGSGSKNVSQVVKTMEMVSCDFGVVISSDELELHERLNIVKVPIPYFLTM
ncbi:MAG: AAA family ATPase [Patescibacteria group bacterium]